MNLDPDLVSRTIP